MTQLHMDAVAAALAVVVNSALTRDQGNAAGGFGVLHGAEKEIDGLFS